MTDVVDKATRSRMMSGIKGKNTKPEMTVRRALHKAGFRYRLHVKELPGKPDIVLPKYKTVVFVHGCFWHKHDCKYFKWPKTRVEFWTEKIEKNFQRDKSNKEKLVSSGWRTIVVWECALDGDKHFDITKIVNKIADWIASPASYFEIDGQQP